MHLNFRLASVWVIISERSTNRQTDGQPNGQSSRANPISAVQVGAAVGGHGRRQALEEQQPRARGGGRRAAFGSVRACGYATTEDGAGGERTRARAHLLERTRRAEEGKCDDDLRHLHAYVCLSAPTIHTKERARPETRSEWGRRQGRKEGGRRPLPRLPFVLVKR